MKNLIKFWFVIISICFLTVVTSTVICCATKGEAFWDIEVSEDSQLEYIS